MVEDREILRLNGGINKLVTSSLMWYHREKSLFLINSSQIINPLSRRSHKQFPVIAS